MPGDFNGDAHVDVVDLLIFADAWTKCAGEAGFDPLCDLYSDGCIDVVDLLMLADNWAT